MARRTRRYFVAKNTMKRILPGRHVWPGPVDDSDSESMRQAEPLIMEWPPGVPKPYVGLVADVDHRPYWTKYRSFLEANQIPFELYEIHRSDWQAVAGRFDLVVWRPMSFPYELEECRRKFWILGEWLGVQTVPRYHEALFYEDKALQFEALRRHDLPVIPTVVTHCEDEAVNQCRAADYPMVWKAVTSSGSEGVELVRDAHSALSRVNSVFSFAGRATPFPYQSQKNVVYIQQYVPGASYDLRVISVGAHSFGYYRDVPKGDFRASGMHTVRFGELPAAAIDLARTVADSLDLTIVAVDMLPSRGAHPYQISEFSVFSGWPQHSEWALMVGGEPGVYETTSEGHVFRPGARWPQHFALARALQRQWIEPRLATGSALEQRRQADGLEAPAALRARSA
jgi:glutathione synthase/RimK-type ligase-like ATP-grasp enzyme